MSSSSEPTAVALPELRSGQWTRFGTDTVLGDVITEDTLSSLAESTRIAARSQGYSVGWAQGQRDARAEASAEAAAAEQLRRHAEDQRAVEHAAAVAGLVEAAALLQAAVIQVCDTVEAQASELAWELTRELVGHEISGPGIDVVRRVLALRPDQPVARVRLNPADLPDAAALEERGVTLVADPSLTRGDAIVEAVDHVLDLRIGAALDRVRDVLLTGEPQ